MNTRLLGAMGEQSAARYLRQNGYEIYSSNFYTAMGELDIVAFKDGLLCFVEVKTRQEGTMLPPAAAVGHQKIENLRSAASFYMNKYSLKCDFRFDIIEVLTDSNFKVTSINHIKGAF